MSLFSIFKDKLSKTSNILSFNILEILKNKKIDDLTLEELENVLISSDISLDVVNQLIDSIKKIKISDDDGIKNVLEVLAQNIENILLPREHSLINEKSDEKKMKLPVGFCLDVRALRSTQNWHHAMRISSQTHICVSKIEQNFYTRASSQEPASTRREGRRPESRYTRAGGASD